MSHTYLCHQATGSGALSETVTPSANFQFEEIHLTVGVAAGTAENLTVTIDDGTGSAYDLPLLVQAMAGQTSVIYIPSRPVKCKYGDKIAVAWTNTDGRTWGLSVWWS